MEIIKELNFATMNYIDFSILGIVGFSILFGMMRGFIMSLMSLAGWFFSIIITYKCAHIVKKALAPYLSSELLLMTLSYSGLLLGALIIFAILNSLIASIMVGLRGGFFDRLLGLLFGLLRGGLICAFFFTCMNFSLTLLAADSGDDEKNTMPKIVKEAQFYNLLKIGNGILMEIIPPNINEKLTITSNAINNEHNKFVGSMIRKLYQEMNDAEISQIEKNVANPNNEEEVAREALRYYKEKLPEGQRKIDKKSLEKLSQTLNHDKGHEMLNDTDF